MDYLCDWRNKVSMEFSTINKEFNKLIICSHTELVGTVNKFLGAHLPVQFCNLKLMARGGGRTKILMKHRLIVFKMTYKSHEVQNLSVWLEWFFTLSCLQEFPFRGWRGGGTVQ